MEKNFPEINNLEKLSNEELVALKQKINNFKTNQINGLNEELKKNDKSLNKCSGWMSTSISAAVVGGMMGFIIPMFWGFAVAGLISCAVSLPFFLKCIKKQSKTDKSIVNVKKEADSAIAEVDGELYRRTLTSSKIESSQKQNSVQKQVEKTETLTKTAKENIK